MSAADPAAHWTASRRSRNLFCSLTHLYFPIGHDCPPAYTLYRVLLSTTDLIYTLSYVEASCQRQTGKSAASALVLLFFFLPSYTPLPFYIYTVYSLSCIFILYLYLASIATYCHILISICFFFLHFCIWLNIWLPPTRAFI